jgi:hypothetical protein
MIFNNFGFNTLARSYVATPPLPPITGGLFLYVDAGLTSSYSGTGSTWVDLSASTGSNTLVFTSGFTSASWINAGESSYFTSSGNYNITSSAATMSGMLVSQSQWSISVWFMNQTAYNTAKGIATWGNTGTNLNYMLTDSNVNSGGPIVEIRGSGQSSDRPATWPMVTGDWGNVLFTFNASGSGAKSAYLNGVLAQVVSGSGITNPTTGTNTNKTPGKFGLLYTLAGTPPLIGRIAIARMWNVQLTAEQVLQDYNYFKGRYITTPSMPSPFLSLDAGNTTSYPGSGSLWTDTVGGRLFTLSGSAGSIPVFSSSFAGATNGSLNFISQSENFAVNTPGFGTASLNWTLEAWFNYKGPSGTPIGEADIITDQFSTAINWALGGAGGNSTGKPGSMTAGGYYSSAWRATDPNYSLPTTGSWYHVVGTCSGTSSYTLCLYVNGVLISANSTNVAPQTSNLGTFLMRNYANAFMGGNLSIVNMYNSGLTANQVLAQYNNNKSKFGLT